MTYNLCKLLIRLIVGQPRDSIAQARAFLDRERLQQEALNREAIAHDRREEELVRENRELRAAYWQGPPRTGTTLTPEYRAKVFTEAARKRFLNLPQNRVPPGHLSALYLLPYLNISVQGVFDAMHNLLLGVNKTIFRRCIGQGHYRTVRGGIGNADPDESDSEADADIFRPTARPAYEMFGPQTGASQARQTPERTGPDLVGGLTPSQLTAIKTAMSEVSTPSNIARLATH